MRRGAKVSVGLLVCVLVAVGSVFVLASGAIDLAGCDEPDVAGSLPAEGLGESKSSAVDEFPVPDEAVEDTCVDADDLDLAVEPDELVEYVLPPDATVDAVLAWYLEAGVIGQPWSDFAWCGIAGNWMEWVEPDDLPRFLDVVIRTRDQTGEDETRVRISVSERRMGGSEEPACPQVTP